jgi:hypothetical protein
VAGGVNALQARTPKSLGQEKVRLYYAGTFLSAW